MLISIKEIGGNLISPYSRYIESIPVYGEVNFHEKILALSHTESACIKTGSCPNIIQYWFKISKRVKSI